MAMSISSPNKHIIFIGNPGCGKSTLLNSLVGKAAFKSGISIGSGLTTAAQCVKHEGITYVDTPGLSDITLRKQAAKEISEALRKNGNYIVLFIWTMDSGRVKAEDITTMQLVLEAIGIQDFTYGIVINKVTPRIIKDVSKSDQFKKITENHFSSSQVPICFYPYDNNLVDADDKVVRPIDNFVQFLGSMNPKMIEAVKVKNIETENFWERNEENVLRLLTNASVVGNILGALAIVLLSVFKAS